MLQTDLLNQPQLTEPKRNILENKNMHLGANGHYWHLYPEAHFEPLHLLFSKLDPSIFLHILKYHLKVSNFHVDHLV